MIKKNFIGLCLLAGFSVISCKKDPSKSAKASIDSTTNIQTGGNDSVSMSKPEVVKADSATENSVQKNTDDTKTKPVIEGKYTANTCDGGRFSIEIKSIGGKPTFKILDKTKTIATGNASVQEADATNSDVTITMGEIGGLVEGDKIVIQNSGNSMNEFEHFTQCGDKYLEFTKQK
ncbi:hypothetical protein [Chryseobacterium sp. MMS23-Vi53]|uniref:hypothetical protein n=1 Tax=Chryseobacterium sp. MMS23-Vi53 TaxID=3386644 RepID=UPI0039EA7000